MSVEGMLCAAGLALLAAGVLARARIASMSRQMPATATETGPRQGRVSGPLGERSPGRWVWTAALWLGVALLVAASAVVFLRFALFAVAS